MLRVVRPAVCGLILLMTFAVLPADAAEDDFAHSWSFELPADFSGPVAIRFTTDLSADSRCEYKETFSGTSSRDTPVRYWTEDENATRKYSGAFYSTYTAHVHDPRIDTRDVVTSGGVWSVTLTRTGPFSAGWNTYTLVGADVSSWTREATGYHAPLSVSFACDEPFTVSGFAGSREAKGFSADSMDGGTGANVDQIVAGAAINMGDTWASSFSAEAVTLATSQRNIDAYTDGELVLGHPGGATSYVVDGVTPIAYHGGPGDYSITLDRVAAGAYQRFNGMMYGLSPIGSLDDVI